MCAGKTITAEIVIVNKKAVAIAADYVVSLVSEATGHPETIFTSANKTFGLSDQDAACLMIYTNSTRWKNL